MADNYLSGKTGYVIVTPSANAGGGDSVFFSFAKWRLSIKVGKPKVTNFNTAPYQALVSGIYAATVTLDGPYNQGSMPLQAGLQYDFVLGWAENIFITVSCIVDLELTNDVDGNPAVMVSGESTGSMGISIA